jgi:hypothetical protein
VSYCLWPTRSFWMARYSMTSFIFSLWRSAYAECVFVPSIGRDDNALGTAAVAFSACGVRHWLNALTAVVSNRLPIVSRKALPALGSMVSLLAANMMNYLVLLAFWLVFLWESRCVCGISVLVSYYAGAFSRGTTGFAIWNLNGDPLISDIGFCPLLSRSLIYTECVTFLNRYIYVCHQMQVHTCRSLFLSYAWRDTTVHTFQPVANIWYY